MERIFCIENLTVVYDRKGVSGDKAVEDISLFLNKGEIFGFLGPNGAGKTTTIKALLGIITPTKGSVSIFNRKVSPQTMHVVGYMPEVANYYWFLTPREILDFYGNIFDIDKNILDKRVDELLNMVELDRASDKLLKTFSKGMLQKVSFAQALINDPEVLILDEPTTGLDPISKMNMRDTLLKLKERGKTIFFSSHELSEVEIICDRVANIKNGKILKETRPKNILDEKGNQISLEKHFFELVRDK